MHSDGDADVDIVSSALTLTNIHPVTLLGEETDLLIILLWHYSLPLHHPVHLYFNSSETAVDIKKSKQLLSDELTHSNLAIVVGLSFCWITNSITKIFEKSRIPNLGSFH